MTNQTRRKTLQRDPMGRELSVYEEEENEDAILRDGQSLRVQMFMRDGVTPNPRLSDVQRAIAETRAHMTFDAAAHKPGFRDQRTASARTALAAEYELYDRESAERYKHTNDASGEFQNRPAEGSVCMVSNPEYPLDHGSAGHIRNGVCVPDKPRSDARTVDAREEAYRLRDLEDADAWRRK